MRFSLVWLVAICVVITSLPSAAVAQEKQCVDVALVLAVDVSTSVTTERWDLQKQGYVLALKSREVMKAIRTGICRSIAVKFVQWAGPNAQRATLSKWNIIRDQETAEVFASHIEHTSRYFRGETAIGDVILFSVALFQDLPFSATRRIIDISGDGVTNGTAFQQSSPSKVLERARKTAIGQGITINGLSLQGEVSDENNVGIKEYYEQKVIGGPGAFSIFVENPDDLDAFTRAVRRKLIMEISLR